jgi:hypothetical protein
MIFHNFSLVADRVNMTEQALVYLQDSRPGEARLCGDHCAAVLAQECRASAYGRAIYPSSGSDHSVQITDLPGKGAPS